MCELMAVKTSRKHSEEEIQTLDVVLPGRTPLSRDPGTPRLPHPPIQGYAELSVSEDIKQELEDYGDGVLMSPGKRKRKQVKIKPVTSSYI